MARDEQLVVYKPVARKFYRGYGAGFVGAGGSIPTAGGTIDTRSPASEPSAFPRREFSGYFGDNAFRDGEGMASESAASVTAAVAVGEGFTIWKSVGAGILVWALTKAIDRFVFRE